MEEIVILKSSIDMDNHIQVKDHNLPPPNPILLVNEQPYNTSTKFKKIQEIKQQSDRHQNFIDSNKIKKKEKPKQNSTLAEYYGDQIPVYKKFDNSKVNYIPFDKNQYFSGLFCNLNQIKQEEQPESLFTQSELLSLLTKKHSKQNFNLLKGSQIAATKQTKGNISNQPNQQQQQIQQQQQLQLQLQQAIPKANIVTVSAAGSSAIQKTTKTGGKQNQKKILQFDSSFESGNLFAAYQVGSQEYDLILQNDINSKGNTQWFYFSVMNTVKNQEVTFNIVNLQKKSSLFSNGMQLVIYSKKKKQLGWIRGGFDISYEINTFIKEGDENDNYFTLKFSYNFLCSNDTVFFAHCYPYTYSDLNARISSLESSNPLIIARSQLCLSIAKNSCEVITITSPSKTKDNKEVIIVMARQHPGETPGSWVMDGILEFLCSQENTESFYLRDKFIFKIIPMVNPDGVIIGNYRTDLTGVDMNRNWLYPNKEKQSIVYSIRKFIIQTSLTHKIRYIIDLHGHSKKQNQINQINSIFTSTRTGTFFYGNPPIQDLEEDHEKARILALLCSEELPFYDFDSCTFTLQQSKMKTARIALNNLLSKEQGTEIFTLETSFFGIQDCLGIRQFTIEDFQKIGSTLCKVIHNIFKEEQKELHLTIEEEQAGIRRRDYQSNKEKVFQRLFKNLKLPLKDIIKKSVDKDSQTQQQENNRRIKESSGSDSDPSGDELTNRESKSLVQKKQVSANKDQINQKFSANISLQSNDEQMSSKKICVGTQTEGKLPSNDTTQWNLFSDKNDNVFDSKSVRKNSFWRQSLGSRQQQYKQAVLSQEPQQSKNVSNVATTFNSNNTDACFTFNQLMITKNQGSGQSSPISYSSNRSPKLMNPVISSQVRNPFKGTSKLTEQIQLFKQKQYNQEVGPRAFQLQFSVRNKCKNKIIPSPTVRVSGSIFQQKEELMINDCLQTQFIERWTQTESKENREYMYMTFQQQHRRNSDLTKQVIMPPIPPIMHSVDTLNIRESKQSHSKSKLDSSLQETNILPQQTFLKLSSSKNTSEFLNDVEQKQSPVFLTPLIATNHNNTQPIEGIASQNNRLFNLSLGQSIEGCSQYQYLGKQGLGVTNIYNKVRLFEIVQSRFNTKNQIAQNNLMNIQGVNPLKSLPNKSNSSPKTNIYNKYMNSLCSSILKSDFNSNNGNNNEQKKQIFPIDLEDRHRAKSSFIQETHQNSEVKKSKKQINHSYDFPSQQDEDCNEISGKNADSSKINVSLLIDLHNNNTNNISNNKQSYKNQVGRNSASLNQSMKLAYQQRQSRKAYNTPFNKRFIDHMLNSS